MDNFLKENHRGSPNLTLLNVLNVLNVLKRPIVGLLGLALFLVALSLPNQRQRFCDHDSKSSCRYSDVAVVFALVVVAVVVDVVVVVVFVVPQVDMWIMNCVQ